MDLPEQQEGKTETDSAFGFSLILITYYSYYLCKFFVFFSARF